MKAATPTITKKLALLGALALSLLFGGCAPGLTPEQQFVAQVDNFVADLTAQQPAGVEAMAPVAVMLETLAPVKGRLLDYEQWVHDEGAGSVSFAAVLLE